MIRKYLSGLKMAVASRQGFLKIVGLGAFTGAVAALVVVLVTWVIVREPRVARVPSSTDDPGDKPGEGTD